MWWLLAACSGSDPAADLDGDGFDASSDCDDRDPFVHPGANEFCDGRDEDCDGVVDGPSPLGVATWTADADHDGYGDPNGETVEGCDPGEGWAREATDCDDDDPSVHPRQPDRCDGRDEDCDGTPDDAPDVPRFADDDGDGYGDPERPTLSCEGTARDPDDCDDTDPETFPDAPERCDGADNDCDGRPDAYEATVDPPTWYADLDQDGFGIADYPLVQCVPPTPSWATTPGDCDDLDPATNPGALQQCTLADTDCDGTPGTDAGWWDPASPGRVPITVTASGPSEGAIVTAVIDFAAARDAVQLADPFDPAGLVVVVQDCTGNPAALPATFVDGMGDPFGPGELADPIGDERGLVTFRLDRPLLAGERVELAAYFGGPPVEPAGGVVATETSIDTPSLSATFDPDRSGTLDALTVAGPAGVVRAISQADAREGNGVLRDGAWSQLGPVVPALASDDPVFGAISADGVHDGVRTAWWWFAWDGAPALFGRVIVEAAEPLAWDAVRPLEVVPLDLVAPLADAGPGWASLSDGTAGVALAWVVAPDDARPPVCDADGCRLEGSEGPSPATTGERLVDDRVLVLVPLVGDADGSEAIEAVLPQVRTTVGGAERP